MPRDTKKKHKPASHIKLIHLREKVCLIKRRDIKKKFKMNEILSVHEFFLCINLQTSINHYNIHYATEHDKAKKCNGSYSFVNYNLYMYVLC